MLELQKHIGDHYHQLHTEKLTLRSQNSQGMTWLLWQVTALDKSHRSLRREGDLQDVPKLTSPPCSPRMTLYTNNNQVY